MAQPDHAVNLTKHRMLAIWLVLLLICALAVMFSYRDNILFFHKQLNLAIWIIGLPLGLAVVFLFLRQWRKIEPVPTGKTLSPFKRNVLIVFTAIAIAIIIRISAAVVIDLTNVTPSVVPLVVDGPGTWTRDCSELTRFRDADGAQFRLCAHRRFSFRRIDIETPLAAGEQVAAHGRSSWAGFAVDKVVRVD